MHASDRSVAGCRRRRVPTLTASLALALAGSGVAAAQASAASIAVAQRCVVNVNPSVGSSMTVGGAGFTPGDSIELQSATGGAFGTATADSSGMFVVNIAA